ncbi:hypothetical protein DSO57_1033988 [Entomophthora muscae]|uniref:Uncharacterized protein n=1 Tax=Entomophthora muscae TaxID=34485 RepID=A0ACC2SZY3_9FUNG|nr:hypothetical protein DSO57_1033988 [Entomophthora muscae]
MEDEPLQSSVADSHHQKRGINEPARTIYFKIRFTSGKDVSLEISEHSTNILKFKEMIGALLPEAPAPTHIRLIYQGRILVDGSKISDVFSKFISAKPSKSLKIQRYSTSSSREASGSDSTLGSIDSPIILHGQILEEPSAANVSDSQLQQIIPQTGFDRLQEAGFSEDDIRSLRTQFQSLHNIDPNSTDPDVLEQTRRLEEAWIDNATSTLPDGSSEGADYEYLWGMIIGFFVGIIAVFWIKEQTFSKKHQIGKYTWLLHQLPNFKTVLTSLQESSLELLSICSLG